MAPASRHLERKGGLDQERGRSASHVFSQSSRQLRGGAAASLDRIPRGSPPGDLRIARPSKIDCIINLETAKAPASRSRSRCCCEQIR